MLSESKSANWTGYVLIAMSAGPKPLERVPWTRLNKDGFECNSLKKMRGRGASPSAPAGTIAAASTLEDPDGSASKTRPRCASPSAACGAPRSVDLMALTMGRRLSSMKQPATPPPGLGAAANQLLVEAMPRKCSREKSDAVTAWLWRAR
eukprot:5565374-Pyramimonas_sp.AAC.1